MICLQNKHNIKVVCENIMFMCMRLKTFDNTSDFDIRDSTIQKC